MRMKTWWLGIVLLAAACAAGGEVMVYSPQVPKGGYPDVWARDYGAGWAFVDMFFSDKAVWGDEPVIVLSRIDPYAPGKQPSSKGDEGISSTGVAVGFFSGRRLPVRLIREELPKRNRDCGDWFARQRMFGEPLVLPRYVYVDTGREMERRYASQRIPCVAQYEVRPPSGGYVAAYYETTMSLADNRSVQDVLALGLGGVILRLDGYSDKWRVERNFSYYRERVSEYEIVFEIIGYEEYGCEPAGWHLVRKTRGCLKNTSAGS